MTMITHTPNPDLEINIDEQGSGRPVLVIHGGGGPRSVAGPVEHLALGHHVLAPTLPGWNGTPRPTWLNRVGDVALALLNVLEDLNLRDVAVVGSSVGGWIAAEMAVRDSDAGRITGLVLLDAVGIEVPGHPIRDFFSLSPSEVAEHTFYDGARFYQDPSTMTDRQRHVSVANLSTLRVLAEHPYMHDPKLERRLARVKVPTELIWGAADGIVTPAYGRAYAAAFRDARFVEIPEAGHLPHVEQPGPVFAQIDRYLGGQDA